MNGNRCNTCHTTGGGTPRNDFGLDWEAAYPNAQDRGLTAAAAFAAVADLDSDGDGVTNAAELADGKHPGNAASTPEPVNEPPTADAVAAETNRGRTVTVTLPGADVDGDALAYLIDRQPSHGTATVSDGEARYSPEPGYTGDDAFTYIVDDGTARSDPATVSVTVVALTPWDTNDSGAVDIVDLVTVAQQFGAVGEGLAADVNGDGVVNIVDLVTVASHFGEADALAAPRVAPVSRPAGVGDWLAEALVADDGSDTFRRGIQVLRMLSSAPASTLSAVGQNYPNPFNPETWIPYRLAEPSEVTVRIYDLRARLVRTLSLGMRPAGYHTTRVGAAHWDGRDEDGSPVSSGVYLYRFTAGAHSQTRRLVVVK